MRLFPARLFLRTRSSFQFGWKCPHKGKQIRLFQGHSILDVDTGNINCRKPRRQKLEVRFKIGKIHSYSMNVPFPIIILLWTVKEMFQILNRIKLVYIHHPELLWPFYLHGMLMISEISNLSLASQSLCSL